MILVFLKGSVKLTDILGDIIILLDVSINSIILYIVYCYIVSEMIFQRTNGGVMGMQVLDYSLKGYASILHANSLFSSFSGHLWCRVI